MMGMGDRNRFQSFEFFCCSHIVVFFGWCVDGTAFFCMCIFVEAVCVVSQEERSEERSEERREEGGEQSTLESNEDLELIQEPDVTIEEFQEEEDF